jgi:hypothetical protein
LHSDFRRRHTPHFASALGTATFAGVSPPVPPPTPAATPFFFGRLAAGTSPSACKWFSPPCVASAKRPLRFRRRSTRFFASSVFSSFFSFL